MQMITKNNKGVTLVALVITIVVLLIIISITINFGLSELHDVADKKIESELGIVQEAVMQRYALVKSSNQLGITAKAISSNTSLEADSERPQKLLGTRIARSEDVLSYGFTGVTLKVEYSANASDKNYEDYYYLLDEKDMNDLGIEKGDTVKTTDGEAEKELSYIVNYSTGEIFDIGNKKYYNSDDYVYKQPTSVGSDNKTYDFSD